MNHIFSEIFNQFMLSITPRRQSVFIIIITTIVFAGVYNSVFDKKLDLNGDNANYYMLGKALASGSGYVNINNIHQTKNYHFPPGYPVIISGLIKIFTDATGTIKKANGVFFLLTLLALYFLVKQITKRESTAIIVLLLVMFNSQLLRYATIIMTEIPFLFFTIIAFLAFLRMNYTKAIGQDFYLYAVIILLTISFYIRTSGVAFIFGILLFLLITKRWQHALAIGLGVLLLALPWQLRNQKVGGSSYVKQLRMVNPYRPELGTANFTAYLARFGHNFNRYLSKEIPAATLPIIKPDYRKPATVSEWLYGLLFFMVIIIGVLHLKKYKILILTYLAGTLTILAFWPDVWIGVRFLLPSVPFLLIGLVSGLQELLLRISPIKLHKYVLWLPVALVILLFPDIKTLRQNAAAEIRPAWSNYYKLATWVNENLASDAVIACRKPTMFYLYSDSYTVNYKFTEDGDELIDDLIDKRVDYVVMEQLGYSATSRYLYPVIQNNPSAFELIYEVNNPDTYLFRFKGE